MKQIGTGVTALAIPIITKFIIQDSFSAEIQLILLLAYLLIITAISSGVFYQRNRDLKIQFDEYKEEAKEKFNKIEEKHDKETSKLIAEKEQLIVNRDSLKDIISDKERVNFMLTAKLALYAFSHPEDVQNRLEQSANSLIGGIPNGSQSNQNNQ